MAAELAVLSAQVHTLQPGTPPATAVAVADGMIVAVGSDAEVREACDARTELVDGRGLTLVPGLTDAHIHALRGALRLVGADCSQADSPAAVHAVLRAERERVAADGGSWVRGHSLRYDALAGTEPHHELLTAALGDDVPAFVTFNDFHTALATPAALAVAGLQDGGAPLAGSAAVVVRDGVPTGELREEEAMDLVRAVLPPLGAARSRQLVVDGLRRLNAMGLTGAHVMDGTLATHALLRELEAAGELCVRLVVPFQIDHDTSADELEELLGHRDARGALWRGGVLKFYADGVVETATAWLEEPDAHGRVTEPFWPDPARYAATVARGSAAGFQCATHAIGDRAVREVVDAYLATGAARERRHRVEHLETMADADVERIAAAGVVASMQAIHQQWGLPDGSDPWATALGPQRTARAFRMGDLVGAGATVALGSDWPVASADPRPGLAWARLRRPPGAPDIAPMQPEQRLTALQALEGYTTHAAHAVGEEAVAGRIAPGLRADLTAFAGDPLGDADTLPDLPVALTVVAGRVVHRA